MGSQASGTRKDIVSLRLVMRDGERMQRKNLTKV
jgi:hypothetical protein